MNRHRSNLPPPLLKLYIVLTQLPSALLSTLSTLAQSNPQANSDGNDSNGNDSAFKVLAEGTQDLAALVGLFATDSVEKYAVDHSRGYFAVALSICSLLGILGYARALLKLAMGAQACQHSGFQTAPVRPISGVAPADRLPSEELITVYYMKREEARGLTHFYLRKRLQHTEESFPCGWTRYSNSRQKSLKNFTTPIPLPKVETQWIGNLSYEESFRSNRGIQLRVWASLIVTAAATAFSVLPLMPKDGAAYWTWTRIMGSFGMFVPLAGSGILWSRVYAREQMPDNHEKGRDAPDEFAFWHHRRADSLVVIADLRCAGRKEEIFNRIASGICAILVVIGYVCQYVEIRRVTATQAAAWLGYQAALVLIRLGVWILDPSFDDYNDHLITGYTPLEPTLGGVHAHDLAMTWMLFVLYSPNNNDILHPRKFHPDGSAPELVYPTALLKRLTEDNMLVLLNGLLGVLERGLSEDEKKELMESTTAIWKPPRGLFQEWLRIRSDGPEKYSGGGRPMSLETVHIPIFVNLGGDVEKPWETGRIIILPLICQSGNGDAFPNGFTMAYRYRIATTEPLSPTDPFHFISDNSEQLRPLYAADRIRKEGFLTKSPDPQGTYIGCPHLRRSYKPTLYNEMMKEFHNRGDGVVFVNIEETYWREATEKMVADVRSAVEKIERGRRWEKMKAERKKGNTGGGVNESSPSSPPPPPPSSSIPSSNASGGPGNVHGQRQGQDPSMSTLRSRNTIKDVDPNTNPNADIDIDAVTNVPTSQPAPSQ